MPSKPLRPAVVRRCTMAAAALTATTAVGAASGAVSANAAEPAPTHAAAANVVVEWNQALLTLVQTPGAQPATIQPTRGFAIMSKAVLDAVRAADHRGAAASPATKAHMSVAQDAAAAEAAHDVLSTLFPTFAGTLDQRLLADLATLPSGRARTEGVASGVRAAAAILRRRASDGATLPPPPYQTTGAAGDYRPTPPAYAAPVFTHWAAVTPFVLRRADQFRPSPPAPLDSFAYAAALNEVKSLGRDTSSTRTPEQTSIATFWNAPIQNYWNAIAEQVATSRHTDTAASAELFAKLDLGLADATIGLYDAKYAYRLWRPITAIRLANTDGNRRTVADPTWNPLATTPADPSYPGAHSTLSAAAATVLTAVYGDRLSFSVVSPTLPGVTRSFRNFHDAAIEAGLSRIYAGLHTRLDHHAGLALGRRVAEYTLAHADDR